MEMDHVSGLTLTQREREREKDNDDIRKDTWSNKSLKSCRSKE